MLVLSRGNDDGNVVLTVNVPDHKLYSDYLDQLISAEPPNLLTPKFASMILAGTSEVVIAKELFREVLDSSRRIRAVHEAKSHMLPEGPRDILSQKVKTIEELLTSIQEDIEKFHELSGENAGLHRHLLRESNSYVPNIVFRVVRQICALFQELKQSVQEYAIIVAEQQIHGGSIVFEAPKAQLSLLVSSTVLDLRDLRGALTHSLRERGYHVMSAELGTIPVDASLHSYDTCLAAARACDCLIGIIDGRFGVELPDGRSVTQAEIDAALEYNRSVLIFIRRSVWDAKEVYKAYMPSSGFVATKIVSDSRVFALIDSVCQRPHGNWVFLFDDSGDILRILDQQLPIIAKRLGSRMMVTGSDLERWKLAPAIDVRDAIDTPEN